MRADEGGRILSDFIDRETGDRVVQVLLTIEGMNHIHMCTLNADTGAIIAIQNRKPSLPYVAQETEGDLVCTNIRTRNLETGDEGLDQTLRRVGSDVDLYTYRDMAPEMDEMIEEILRGGAWGSYRRVDLVLTCVPFLAQKRGVRGSGDRGTSVSRKVRAPIEQDAG